MQDKKITTWAQNELQTAQEPFFMVVGYTKPHAPFLFRDQDIEHYTKANDVPPEQQCFTSEHIITWTDDLTIYNPNGYSFSDAKKTQHHKTPCTSEYQASVAGAKQTRRFYRASVSYMDSNVEKVIAALGDKIDNTVVIFSSDHGFLLGKNNMFAKKANVFEATNVPFLVQHPDQPPEVKNTFTNELFGLVDLFPTIVGFVNRRRETRGEAQMVLPSDLDGFDLSHIFLGESGGYLRTTLSHVYPAAYYNSFKPNGQPDFNTNLNLWNNERKNANQAYLSDIAYLANNVITKEYRYTVWRRFDFSEPETEEALYKYSLSARADQATFELFSLSNDPSYTDIKTRLSPYLLNPETPSNIFV